MFFPAENVYTSERVPDKTSVSSSARIGAPLPMRVWTPSPSLLCRQHQAATHRHLWISVLETCNCDTTITLKKKKKNSISILWFDFYPLHWKLMTAENERLEAWTVLSRKVTPNLVKEQLLGGSPSLRSIPCPESWPVNPELPSLILTNISKGLSMLRNFNLQIHSEDRRINFIKLDTLMLVPPASLREKPKVALRAWSQSKRNFLGTLND